MNLYEEVSELVERARIEGISDIEIQDVLASIHLEIINLLYLKNHYGGDVPPRLEIRTV